MRSSGLKVDAIVGGHSHVILGVDVGEAPLEDFEKEQLAEGLRAYGHRSAHLLDTPNDLAESVFGFAQEGDLVMCLGAGSITQWAADLPAELDRLHTSRQLTSQSSLTSQKGDL